MPRDKIVHVSTKSMAALVEPAFIIKKGDVYYVTVAVLEYDMSDARTEEQKIGVDKIRDLFRRASGNEIPCVPMRNMLSEDDELKPPGVQTEPDQIA